MFTPTKTHLFKRLGKYTKKIYLKNTQLTLNGMVLMFE